MIFPVSGVNVMHVSDRSFVVDPSHVALSNGGDVYRVSHPMGSGEVTVHLAIEEETLLGVLETRHPQLPASKGRPFPRGQVKRSPQLHLALLQLIAACEAEVRDEVEVEESALGLADRVAGELATLEGIPESSVSRFDRELADAAAILLAARYTEPLSLDGISETLGVTKFRLCRVFKHANGETLWQRVQQLRARHAALELADGAGNLVDLALALGFSSHSHFTSCFRQVFGTTPSAMRGPTRAK